MLSKIKISLQLFVLKDVTACNISIFTKDLITLARKIMVIKGYFTKHLIIFGYLCENLYLCFRKNK